MNKILENYYLAREKHDRALEELDKEFERIVEVIRKFFNQHSRDFWFSYRFYEDGEQQPLPTRVDSGVFKCYMGGNCANDAWDYSQGFPVRFFDMTNQEIATYLEDETDKAKKAKEKKNLALRTKSEAKRLKKAKVLEEAKAKLTPEQIKVLGL